MEILFRINCNNHLQYKLEMMRKDAKFMLWPRLIDIAHSLPSTLTNFHSCLVLLLILTCHRILFNVQLSLLNINTLRFQPSASINTLTPSSTLSPSSTTRPYSFG
eukprot:GILI01029322.1.p1 GENE.GILI01029322.1~~GILI01029322.1.p1  ORF type:complete len:105 (+),score=5.48 GILI01029322.1:63-377(+)